MNKCFSMLGLILVSMNLHAHTTITVDVETNDKTAAAIGYSVNGASKGGLGNHYHGTGPANTEYRFGYKKGSIFGKDQPCGSLILKQNSHVLLNVNGTQCVAMLR